MHTKYLLICLLILAAFLLLPVEAKSVYKINSDKVLNKSSYRLGYEKPDFGLIKNSNSVADNNLSLSAIFFKKTGKKVDIMNYIFPRQARVSAVNGNFVPRNSTRVNVLVTDDAGNPMKDVVVDIDLVECHIENTTRCVPDRTHTWWYQGFAGLTDASGRVTIDVNFKVDNYDEQIKVQVPRAIFLDGKVKPDENNMFVPYLSQTTVYQTFGPNKSAYFNESDIAGKEFNITFKLLTGDANFNPIISGADGAVYSTYAELPFDVITSSIPMQDSNEVAYNGCIETAKYAVPYDYGDATAGWNCTFAVSKYNSTKYNFFFRELVRHYDPITGEVTMTPGTKTATTSFEFRNGQTYTPTVVLNE